MPKIDYAAYENCMPEIKELCSVLLNAADKVVQKLDLSVRLNPSEFDNLMFKVIDELRYHYPNIRDHSRVKWAGHVAAAIADRNPFKFVGYHKFNDPHNLQIINSKIAIAFAFSLLNFAYYDKIIKAKYNTNGKHVMNMKYSISENLVSTLIYKNYLLNSGKPTVNPVLLTESFELFLEGRYPNAIPKGSSW